MDVVQLSQCVAETGNDDEAAKNLGEFNKKHTQSFAFPDITKDQKTKLIGALTERLSRKCSVGCYVACLNTIRILSREQAGVDDMASEASLKQLVVHAGLEAFDGDNAEEAPEKTIEDKNLPVIIEAQKCLCNILFHSPKAQRTCVSNGCVEGIIQRLKTYRDQTICHEIKFFDMRILFLLTALCADIRPKIRRELHGLTYLIEVLDLCIQESSEKNVPIEDKDVDLCSEILKILFNLTVSVDKNNLAEEEEAHFLRLVSVLHDLLVCDIAAKTKREELHSHTVNLLTNMPADSYEELLTPLNEDQDGNVVNNRKQTEYDDKNVQAIVSLLEFLDKRLDKPQKSIMESLTPILHCLCETCRSNRTIRKFCRSKILPYMKEEVKKLPTEGNTLRNKLCKLLTNPITEVKDLAADLLFVLCKESVARFVKYTGYGNAAGLLAQRGLMCGGRGAEYSSDSEDSETEEYSALQDKINPITGRWEEDKPDPMAGMTEEQKEYEAMKLVEQIDELARKGLIEPCVVGTDGRPHPIEHVQQLLEGQNLNEEKKLSEEQKKTEDK